MTMGFHFLERTCKRPLVLLDSVQRDHITGAVPAGVAVQEVSVLFAQ
jgi:hypothetical protein